MGLGFAPRKNRKIWMGFLEDPKDFEGLVAKLISTAYEQGDMDCQGCAEVMGQHDYIVSFTWSSWGRITSIGG